MGVQRRLLQASYSIDSENIHSRNWKICSACLRQDAVSIKGCEAQLQLESQINPKGWKTGQQKYLEQSIPWNLQIDVYLMLSLIHCWIFKMVTGLSHYKRANKNVLVEKAVLLHHNCVWGYIWYSLSITSTTHSRFSSPPVRTVTGLCVGIITCIWLSYLTDLSP